MTEDEFRFVPAVFVNPPARLARTGRALLLHSLPSLSFLVIMPVIARPLHSAA